MNTKFSVAIAALAGLAIGVTATQGLHAQSKAPAYTIAEVEVIDPPAFQSFVKRFSPAVAAAGGHFLANVHGQILTINGIPPKAVNLIAWGSLEQASAFFSSPAFKALIPLRDKGAKVLVFGVEGLPK